jgi:DNA modification methylase
MQLPCTNPVEMWPIDRPKPNPDNARMHLDDQIRQIARSVETHQLNRAIQVDETDTILTGHGLLLALRYLGYQEVPVQVLSHLTGAEKQTYLIADNQIAANSTWDEQKLGLTLQKLEKELVNLDVIGFSPQELDRILADLEPEDLDVDPEAVPEVPTLAVTVPGDLWILGRHRVLCGDSLLDGISERVLGGQTADIAFLAPPYNVNYSQKSRGIKIANDNLGSNFEEFLQSACTRILAVTKGAVYICMSSSEVHTLARAFKAAGGHRSTYIIWAKDRFTLSRSDYQQQFEIILYGWKEGGAHFWCGARNEGNVWCVPKPKRNRLHPTMKPVSLIERGIRNSSQRGDLVLDLFGGAGSTLIACEKSGRRAAVVELEPKYVDVIVRRWEGYAHQEARLENDGRSLRQSPRGSCWRQRRRTVTCEENHSRLGTSSGKAAGEEAAINGPRLFN